MVLGPYTGERRNILENPSRGMRDCPRAKCEAFTLHRVWDKRTPEKRTYYLIYVEAFEGLSQIIVLDFLRFSMVLRVGCLWHLLSRCQPSALSFVSDHFLILAALCQKQSQTIWEKQQQRALIRTTLAGLPSKRRTTTSDNTKKQTITRTPRSDSETYKSRSELNINNCHWWKSGNCCLSKM